MPIRYSWQRYQLDPPLRSNSGGFFCVRYIHCEGENAMLHVVVYSGGLDSFTLLHKVIDDIALRGDQVEAITFDYGQRAFKELEYARLVCAKLGIRQEMIYLGNLVEQVMRGSALTDFNIIMPTSKDLDALEHKANVVPGRNSVMLAIGMAYCESMLIRDAGFGEAALYFGAHKEASYYPDTSPRFIAKMQDVFSTATQNSVRLVAPYQAMTKGEIVKEGMRKALDYGEAWSCYASGPEPCGACSACSQRREAFSQTHYIDPAIPVLSRP
jgi:7-cyano-7-deazaguanine synthase